MKPEKNNTFCFYPFYQIALKRWGPLGFDTAAPCCNAIRPENDNPLNLDNTCYFMTHEDAFNSPIMINLRQSMLEGKRHSACSTCWKMEDNGMTSYRFYSDSDFDFTEQNLTDPKLTSIDFSFGENCNLRCRMCQPGLSNKLRIDYKYFHKNNLNTEDIGGFERNRKEYDAWSKEKSEQDVLSFPEESYQWNYILNNITKITNLRAAGGETTITKPFLEFIDRAIFVNHSQNVTLKFHTNATKFTDELLDKLQKFKRLDLNFSIDSFGKNYEYIRYPMTWSSLDKSINNFFKKTKNVPVSIQFSNVLSSINAFNIPYIYEYYKKIKEEYTHANLSFWVDFIWPDNKFTNVKFLSKELKQELIDLYTQTFEDYDYPIQHIIKYLENNLDLEIRDVHRQNMLREITVFDKSRNQNYRDYIDPRISEFLETIIND